MDEPAGSRSVALPVRRPFACARPAELYGGDDDPFGVLALHDLDVPTAERLLGLPRAAAAAAVRAGQQASFARLFPLIRAAPKLLAPLQHVYRRTYVRGEAPLRIVDVRPVEPVFAAQPFALAVRCQSLGPDRIVLVSVEVGWAGEPFVVERSVEPDDPADGVVHVVFGDEQALPVGPTDFTVSVWRAAVSYTHLTLPTNREV